MVDLKVSFQVLQSQGSSPVHCSVAERLSLEVCDEGRLEGAAVL